MAHRDSLKNDLVTLIADASALAEELLDDVELSQSDPAAFDAALSRFVTDTEKVTEALNRAGEESIQTIRGALSQFAEVHSKVMDLAGKVKEKVAERLAALERNRPALIKYSVQRR
jgi:hypothetical protein